jgi:hypothetical protein
MKTHVRLRTDHSEIKLGWSFTEACRKTLLRARQDAEVSLPVVIRLEVI